MTTLPVSAASVSPLRRRLIADMTMHINLTGDYIWSYEPRIEADGFRPSIEPGRTALMFSICPLTVVWHPVLCRLPDRLLASLSPVTWEHVTLTGDYVWEEPPGIDQTGFRPLTPTP